MSNVKPEKKTESEDHPQTDYECNICLETAKDAVVSFCGHLFCWPCLHLWLETRPDKQVCPVCKAVISKEKVIPLYGRGFTQKDPREKLPPRPQGQRTESDENLTNGRGIWTNANGLNYSGFQMTLGIGGFPFGIFTSTFNFGGSRHRYENVDSESESMVNCVFLTMAFIFIVWLIIA